MPLPSHLRLAAPTGPPSKLLLALGSAAVLSAACTAESTAPAKALPPEAGAVPSVAPSFNMSTGQRGQLQAALLFAGAQSRLALKERAAADRVQSALERVAASLDQGDVGQADRALAVARDAVAHYRKIAGSATEGAADLAAMELTLERATQLTRATTSGIETTTSPAPTLTPTPESTP